MSRNSPWLQPRTAGQTPRLRLFCLPHAGGGATQFRTWSASLPPSIQVCPVLLPGREQRSAEPPHTRFEELAAAMDSQLRPWLDLPYAIFGHSMGSLLAYEWTRRLAQDRQPLPAWLFLSGRRAPDPEPEPKPLHSLPDREFLLELNRRYQGIPQEVFGEPEFLEVFLPILRADISVVESYRFQPAEPLDCPITVFAGMSDPSVTWPQLRAWKTFTRRRFAMQILSGGHFYPQAPLLETIARTLNRVPIPAEPQSLQFSGA